MDLYQLKVFFTLGKVRSFTETANFLGVTQSAVSHSIKKLENSTDTRLIRRKGKQFSLTEAGQTLFSSCEVIFYELDKAADALGRFKAGSVCRIYLGSPVEFGTTILLRHVKGFMEENPGFHVDFLFSNHLREPYVRDEVDFIIDCKDHALPDTDKRFLFVEQYVTVGSPAFLEANAIGNLRDLERVNVLSLDKEGLWWSHFRNAVPVEYSGVLKNIMQITHVRGLINGAAHGLGIAFVPRYAVVRELEAGTLVDPFPHVQPTADHFNIFIKRRKAALPKNRMLIDYLLQIKPAEFGVGPA